MSNEFFVFCLCALVGTSVFLQRVWWTTELSEKCQILFACCFLPFLVVLRWHAAIVFGGKIRWVFGLTRLQGLTRLVTSATQRSRSEDGGGARHDLESTSL